MIRPDPCRIGAAAFLQTAVAQRLKKDRTMSNADFHIGDCCRFRDFLVVTETDILKAVKQHILPMPLCLAEPLSQKEKTGVHQGYGPKRKFRTRMSWLTAGMIHSRPDPRD